MHYGRVLLGSTVFSSWGWLDFLVFYSEKKPFSVGLVDQLFQPASNKVETVEKALAATAVVYAGLLTSAAGSYPVVFPQLVNAQKSGNNYSQELPRFNRKRLEKCSIWKPQLLQPKPVAVETVDPNGTRPMLCLKNEQQCSIAPSELRTKVQIVRGR